MKLTFLFFSFLFLVLLPQVGSAEEVPVISANGFACSTQGGLVQCRGAFPGHASPVLNVLGSQVVGMVAQYPDHVWNYRSDTGCLCKGTRDSVDCTSSAGSKKEFSGADKVAASSAWCGQHAK